tara:strand:- start:29894 stop:30355 length:462 start_codon:yes stop_codon:yes gene_type:complete
MVVELSVEHPAGLTRAVAFTGVECEGEVMFGKQTLFLRGEPDLCDLVLDGIEQVFLTEAFNDWEWFSRVLVKECRDRTIPITVGRHSEDAAEFLKSPHAGHARMIVRFFDCDWHSLLRPMDEVSVGVVYDMRTWKVADGVVTLPEQYVGDRQA